jgi:hypothetical protein
MDHHIQSKAPSLSARLSHPRGIRGNLHRNGRPAPQSRPAAPIARCSTGALAPISTPNSSPDWMNVGGHSKTGVLAIEIPIMDTLIPLVMGRRHRHYCWDHTLFMSRARADEFLQKAGFKVLHTELTGRCIRLKRLASRLSESYGSLGQFLEGAFKTLHIEQRIVHSQRARQLPDLLSTGFQLKSSRSIETQL